eukprot:1721461-Pyramimonas_sp.AAC.1
MSLTKVKCVDTLTATLLLVRLGAGATAHLPHLPALHHWGPYPPRRRQVRKPSNYCLALERNLLGSTRCERIVTVPELMSNSLHGQLEHAARCAWCHGWVSSSPRGTCSPCSTPTLCPTSCSPPGCRW